MDHHYLFTHCNLLRYFWTNHSHSIRLETLTMTGGWKPLIHKWTWGWKPSSWLEIGNPDHVWRLENFQHLYINGLEIGDPDHDWRLETLIITGGKIPFEHKWTEDWKHFIHKWTADILSLLMNFSFNFVQSIVIPSCSKWWEQSAWSPSWSWSCPSRGRCSHRKNQSRWQRGCHSFRRRTRLWHWRSRHRWNFHALHLRMFRYLPQNS